RPLLRARANPVPLRPPPPLDVASVRLSWPSYPGRRLPLPRQRRAGPRGSDQGTQPALARTTGRRYSRDTRLLPRRGVSRHGDEPRAEVGNGLPEGVGLVHPPSHRWRYWCRGIEGREAVELRPPRLPH